MSWIVLEVRVRGRDGTKDASQDAKGVAVKAFSKWLASTDSGKRLHESPLAELRVPGGESERRRRALTVPEQKDFLRLVAFQSTMRGTMGDGSRWELTDPDRRLLYWFPLETGLRAKEIRECERRFLTLEGDRPRLTLPPHVTKSKRAAEIALSPAIVEALREHSRSKTDAAPLLALPATSAFSRMISRDLANVRQAWLSEAGMVPDEYTRRAESDYLAATNKRDEVVDFHALRVSAVTTWIEAGMPLHRVQERARHKDAAITLGICTKVQDAVKREDVRFVPCLVDSVTEFVTNRRAVGDGVTCHSDDTKPGVRMAINGPEYPTGQTRPPLGFSGSSPENPAPSSNVHRLESAGGGT
jgi:hypothetical protein